MYSPANAYHRAPATTELLDERKASTAGWWVEALSLWVRKCARTLLHWWMRDWRALLNGDQRHCPPSYECCARRGIAALDCWMTNTTFLDGGLSSIQVSPPLCKRTTALLDERVASTAGWWAYALSASIRADLQLITEELLGARERGHY